MTPRRRWSCAEICSLEHDRQQQKSEVTWNPISSTFPADVQERKLATAGSYRLSDLLANGLLTETTKAGSDRLRDDQSRLDSSADTVIEGSPAKKSISQPAGPNARRRSSHLLLRRMSMQAAPYHVLSFQSKRHLVYIISFAALFSPLSSNIYFPALDNIATALRANIADVNLSITVYMIFQGLAPSIWGSLADAVGRRPVFLATFCVYEAASMGLAFSGNITTLTILRAVQAIGSSATISIGAGVIGDVTTPDERGGFVGLFGGIRMLGQAIGPIIGGVLTQYLGFRSIFMFLFILGAIAVATLTVFLPETLRQIAGNGTIRLHGIYRPLSLKFARLGETSEGLESERPRPKMAWKTIFDPARMLAEKDIFVILFFGSIVYAVWSMVTASTTNLFQHIYHLDDLTVGLAFLPNGVGCILGSYVTGRILDRDFRCSEHGYRQANNIPETLKFDRKALQGSLMEFPIERARMRNLWWNIVIFCAATTAYGFSLSTHIAVALVLQFCIAYTATAVFSVNSTLIIDLYPGKSASATAVNNLMRCTVGAIGVAVVDLLLVKTGVRITFVSLASLTTVSSLLVAIEWVWGKTWRLAREARMADRKV